LAQRIRDVQQVRNRIPPHNLDAEQSVLGAMLESKEAIANVIEILKADDFYKPAHTEIYEATMAIEQRGGDCGRASGRAPRGTFSRQQGVDVVIDEHRDRELVDGLQHNAFRGSPDHGFHWPRMV